MDYYLRSRDLSGEVIWAGGVPQEQIYLAFSPESIRGSQLRAIYDAGVKRLRQSGELASIYRSYGLQP